MAFQLLVENLAPAEGETSVRSYQCTTISSRLLSLKAEGYLTVTNKRVVFYARGSSYGGQSVLQSEVPIDDVSGISCYKGTYFSLAHLLTAAVVSFIVGSIIAAVFSGLVVVALGRVQNLQNAQNAELLFGILAAIFIIGSLAFLLASFVFRRESIIRSILAASGTLVLTGTSTISSLIVSLIPYLTFTTIGRDSASWIPILISLVGILAFFAGLYTLLCFLWYARRQTMSLSVGSKGGSSTPIAISGISGFGLYNTAAMRALTAEPAKDADAMIKQLGAMITDIQTMGDLGIRKWAQA